MSRTVTYPWAFQPCLSPTPPTMLTQCNNFNASNKSSIYCRKKSYRKLSSLVLGLFLPYFDGVIGLTTIFLPHKPSKQAGHMFHAVRNLSLSASPRFSSSLSNRRAINKASSAWRDAPFFVISLNQGLLVCGWGTACQYRRGLIPGPATELIEIKPERRNVREVPIHSNNLKTSEHFAIHYGAMLRNAIN